MAILPSLKQTLTVYFLLVAAIPVLLFGLVGLELIADYQLKDIHARNMKSAQSVAGEVSSFLLEVQSDLHQIEETINSRSIIQPGGENDYLGIAIRNSRFLESIYLLDADRRIRHLGVMPQLHARRGDYMQLDFSSHQIFQNDPMFTNPAWSDTFVSLVTGEPAVTLGLPIRHGALLGNIRLVSLSRLLQRYSTREELAFAIIDSTGALIAHSDNDLALLRMNFNTHPVVASALSGTELTGEHRHDSATYLESVARVEPAGWVVWASLNLEAVQAPIRSLRNLLVGFMLLAFLLAGIIAVINVRRLMLPLNALGSRARKIADGDYAFRFRPSGFEEIDTLADQFAKMSEAIQVREESIVSSEKKFRNLVNSIDGIVWEMDYPSSRFLFVSKQSESILGYPPGDWLAHENFWKEIAHPDDVEPSFTYCRMMSEKHEDHSFEFRGIAADGRTVWIRNLISVMVEAGRPVRLLGVMIDISQQMELLENLERSERNYREIFNATSEAIFIHDKETGEILDVNQAMLDVYGCEYAEALQLTIADLSLNQPPYTLSEAMGRLKMAAERGDCVYEWRSRRRNGDLFWAEVALKRAMIAGQERVISVVRDISERKEAERQLETYRGHLETLVKERTQQLEDTQEELVQKERLAVLGQLTATVSHEIRNPLGTIANSLFLLQDSLEGIGFSGWERPLSLAERNVQRCDGIISELLDFSRERAIQPAPMDLDVWLSELLGEMLFPDGFTKQWRLSSQATVNADPERLRRAMVNILTNAVQALEEMSEQEQLLQVSTLLDDNCCRIEVTDNGPGMSADILAQIFQPMFSTKNFGVGLGVPIIKNIIEDHGGELEYLSEPGSGTTVVVRLPILPD